MRKLISTLLITGLTLSLTPGMAAAGVGAGTTVAQDSVRTIDPNQAIDADLSTPRGSTPGPPRIQPSQSMNDTPPSYPPYNPQAPAVGPGVSASTTPETVDAQQQVARQGAETVAATGETFNRTELLSAAEGALGKGTAGLAGMLEKILKDQGEPNAYIAGREAGGALVVGLRYGKGEMFHKIEGQQPVYWTGPSVGFDVGGDASKVFVLVYNLNDTEELYSKRFAAGEGRLFFVGGVAASYLRKGDKVVIPIRLGVGWRQGVNIGYMKFSHESKWFPF